MGFPYEDSLLFGAIKYPLSIGKPLLSSTQYPLSASMQKRRTTIVRKKERIRVRKLTLMSRFRAYSIFIEISYRSILNLLRLAFLYIFEARPPVEKTLQSRSFICIIWSMKFFYDFRCVLVYSVVVNFGIKNFKFSCKR